MKTLTLTLLLLCSISASAQTVTVRDNEFKIVSGADTTKQIYFDAGALPSNSTRGYRVPSVPASVALMYGSAFYPSNGTIPTHASNGILIGSRISDNGVPNSPFSINASAAAVNVNGNQINLSAVDVLSLSAENGVQFNSPIVLKDLGEKPDCDEDHRLWIWPKRGEDPDDDTVEICISRGGVWAWRSLL